MFVMIVRLFRVVKSRNNLHHEGRVDLLRVVVGQQVRKKNGPKNPCFCGLHIFIQLCDMTLLFGQWSIV